MDRFSRAKNYAGGLISVGAIAQIAGLVVLYRVFVGKFEHARRALIVGGLVFTGGIWVFVAGFMWVGVVVVLGSTREATVRTPRTPEPPQHDPAQLPDDPAPFLPHEGDSVVVAAVRRALLLAMPTRSVRRIVNRAATSGQLDEHDLALVEALILEGARRPVAPLPVDF